ncbi:FKBP-type peptidyl-prolyl cis-trans isomerase [Shewanella seohaensis]|uniref:FKBP-type peptidyl-prolyl cis-trans isomerase n=1 Tax=Shewanella seohaensis TaxID=755175 RepID=UPI0035B8A0F9
MKMLLAVVVIAGVIFYFFTSMNNQKAAQENIRLGNEFLAQNKTQEGVKTTASGLQYQVLQQGTGTVHPKATDTVTVHYHGTLIDGTVFDSSVERGEPIAFPLNRVIPGWTEGVQLMVEGDKYRFFIPSELAYGNRSTGKIGGGSVLIFDVELLKIN